MARLEPDGFPIVGDHPATHVFGRILAADQVPFGNHLNFVPNDCLASDSKSRFGLAAEFIPDRWKKRSRRR